MYCTCQTIFLKSKTGKRDPKSSKLSLFYYFSIILPFIKKKKMDSGNILYILYYNINTNVLFNYFKVILKTIRSFICVLYANSYDYIFTMFKSIIFF